ncbi:sulfite exporter TauE/SafE family protein [Enterococcus saccharolyticus]|uniref:sulfite exporter TauE/SafE family protein n=1 Tax=Enterococcus saccharolyticus TaxID=41997 RepID=UPI001E5CD1DD|nr:sulfite exporter TauE/SafE family protein [Enterococcus saccharolyticus]MCD5002369.1 sulfite exporter TauE/SafE family protein [Enterococcus saccharolyticus]
MIGIIYFFVIIVANTLGSVSGMGGGILIKPIFDLINVHSVSAISFYSSVAVFVMSIVSVTRQMKDSKKFNWIIAGWVSLGSISGGILGSITLEFFLKAFENESVVQWIQIILTIITLVFAFLYTRFEWESFCLSSTLAFYICGLVLGFLASLLGIGGGPINVSLLMLIFGFSIKNAAVYSLCTIFFSQFAKLLTIGFTTGFAQYDLNLLWFIIIAAVLGGLLGSKVSSLLSPKKVVIVFQVLIIIVLLINVYNGLQLF